MPLRTALITGCSSGFGQELVRLLLARDWRVIATMRNLESRKALFADEARSAGDRLQVLELDVTNADQRHAVIKHISEISGGKLDCLVNNAGYGLFGAFEDCSDEQIREQIEVNFFGLALLTKDALPLLRSARGKVIQLSSILGLVGAPLNSMYCASKFAVEGLSECLAFELAPYGVQLCIVEPGGHRTDFGRKIVWAESSGEADSPYSKKSNRYRRMLGGMLNENGTPSSPVVRKIARLAEQRSLPLRVRCGLDAKAMHAFRSILPQIIYVPLVKLVSKLMYYRD